MKINNLVIYMTNKTIKILLILLFHFGLFQYNTYLGIAQDAMPSDRAAFYRFGEQFFFDAYSQPNMNGDSQQVFIFYRIAYDAMVFNQSSSGNNFFSIVQIDAAFRDNSSIIRRRAIAMDTISVATFEATRGKDSYLIGYIETTIALSDFTVQIQLTDNRNQNLHRHTINFKINNLTNSEAKIFTPLFTIENRGSTNLSILNSSIPFSSNPVNFYLPAIVQSNEKSFSYFITRRSERGQANWGDFRDLIGSVRLMKSHSLEFDLNGSHVTAISNQRMNEDNNSLLVIELSGNSFVPGNYDLFLINDITKDTIKYHFKTIWENMPLALRNPEYAVKMMEYILTDSEFRAMRSGSNNDRLRKLLEYWKAHDPTPFTPYNEAMAEYFRRVDYAFFNFQTLTEKDGAATDRGKIFILFGNPDNVRTSLQNNRTQEIWYYQSLIKEFTFELVSTGVFKLTDIKE